MFFCWWYLAPPQRPLPNNVFISTGGSLRAKRDQRGIERVEEDLIPAVEIKAIFGIVIYRSEIFSFINTVIVCAIELIGKEE